MATSNFQNFDTDELMSDYEVLSLPNRNNEDTIDFSSQLVQEKNFERNEKRRRERENHAKKIKKHAVKEESELAKIVTSLSDGKPRVLFESKNKVCKFKTPSCITSFAYSILPDFYGDELPSDARLWISTVKRRAEIYGWDHAEIMSLVRNVLGGEAHDWLARLELDHEITWEIFLDKFKKRFLNMDEERSYIDIKLTHNELRFSYILHFNIKIIILIFLMFLLMLYIFCFVLLLLLQ